MCKHISSTAVNAHFDDGTPVRIRQCDMCGLSLPKKPVGGGEETDIELDWKALQVALDRIFAPIKKGK